MGQCLTKNGCCSLFFVKKNYKLLHPDSRFFIPPLCQLPPIFDVVSFFVLCFRSREKAFQTITQRREEREKSSSSQEQAPNLTPLFFAADSSKCNQRPKWSLFFLLPLVPRGQKEPVFTPDFFLFFRKRKIYEPLVPAQWSLFCSFVSCTPCFFLGYKIRATKQEELKSKI